MSRMDFWRQEGIVPSDKLQFPVTLVGAGGIGSPTALALTKMGINNLTVFDDDTVELHNLPNQIYRFEDIGKHKVVSLAGICKDFTGVDITTVPQKLNGHALKGVVVSGVDTMASRKEIWEKIKYKPSIELYIEARMGAEVARINSVRPCDPDDVGWYESTLYSDEEALEAPCTERAIIYNVFSIAGLIGSQLKKYAKSETFPREIIFDFVTLTLLSQ